MDGSSFLNEDEMSNTSTGSITINLRQHSEFDLNSSRNTANTTACLRRRDYSNYTLMNESNSDSSSTYVSNRYDNVQQQNNSNVTDNDLLNLDQENVIDDAHSAHRTNDLDYSTSNYITDSTDDSTSESSDNEMDVDDQSPFTKLFSLLQKDDCNERITAQFIVNKIEVMFAILMFAFKYCLTNTAVADLCKMLNTFLDSSVIPDSRYMLDHLFYPGGGIEYHAVCPKCNMYIKEFKKTEKFINCSICEYTIRVKDPSYHDFFVVIDISSQLKSVLEKNSEYYTEIMNRRDGGTDKYTDIFDGQKYKQFVASLPRQDKQSYVTVTFNSDGSPLFKSSKFSVWPIQINPNEIPPSMRNNRPLTYALWFGHSKPDMNIFLAPFVKTMNNLSENGVLCNINGERKKIKVYGLCCCVDTIARAPMQGFVQFNGYYGCPWCLHPGQLVRHDKGATIKYTLQNEIISKRTEELTLRHITEAVNINKPVSGVKKATPLLNLKNFNIIDGFVPDHMHCISLGIVRQFLNYWINSSNKPYSISNSDLKRIDEYLKNFKVPTQLARLSRSLEDRHFWTSRENENWLLHYSLPILRDIEGFEIYATHWADLVEAFHLMSKDCITIHELERADILLKLFVGNTQRLYSEAAMSFNVHQLLHIPQSIADWGPLWCHCGYPFESGNGHIKKTVHAAKGVINQMCRNLSIRESLLILESHVKQNEDSPVLDYCKNLDALFTKKTLKLENIRYFSISKCVDERFYQIINLESQNIRAYNKCIKNSCLFKSNKKQLQRSNNSIIQTSSLEYMQILQFIVDLDNRREYTLCQKITVQNDNLRSIKTVVRIEENVEVIETQQIQKLCVLMTVNQKTYISEIPHMYWYS